MNELLIAVAVAVGVVTAVGLVCAVILVVASKFFSVKVDERRQRLRECLPGANCGACGYTGCDGYAQALADNPDTKTNLCIPGADAVSKQISEIIGVEFEDVVEQVAFVRCGGDCSSTQKKHEYSGIPTCAAAKMYFGGDGTCAFGCLGYGDCAGVCPQDAVCIENGIAHIDQRKCIGCGLCAKACPQKIITLFPDVAATAVSCSSREKGALARKQCSNACIGCRKCEKSCPHGAITVTDNLASIDYGKCVSCGVCAEVCPTHVIKQADFSGGHRR